MGKPRAIEKKFKIYFMEYYKKNCYLCYSQSKFNCPRIVKKSEILLRDSKVIYYVLHNNFFYTQLAFAFDPQKGFYIVHDNTDAFFIFLLQ